MLFDKRGLEIARREGFIGRTMTQLDDITMQAELGSRLGRLPFVLLLTVGLLLSLLHCTGCGLAFAKTDAATAITNVDSGSAPETPEQQLPCHSGHCLSHFAAQAVAVVTLPADLVLRKPAFGREQFPAALAGLPLFKPPRA
jgi:hypothetical protein